MQQWKGNESGAGEYTAPAQGLHSACGGQYKDWRLRGSEGRERGKRAEEVREGGEWVRRARDESRERERGRRAVEESEGGERGRRAGEEIRGVPVATSRGGGGRR